VTVGFSMGASIALRHAGLTGGVDAVVAVSSPGHWYYRGTKPMRRVHLGIQHRLGRMMLARFWDTRISGGRWDPDPVPPAEAAALIAPTPLLIVHGDQDAFFPVDHARDLYEAAGEPRELWIIPGFGHAEAGSGPALIDRIGGWLLSAVAAGEPAPSEPPPATPPPARPPAARPPATQSASGSRWRPGAAAGTVRPRPAGGPPVRGKGRAHLARGM
jgi:hypothetical protein